MLYTLPEFKGVVSIFYQPHRAWLTLQCYTYHTEVQRNKNSKFYRSNTLAILWLPDYTELSCNSLEWKTLVFSELTSSVLGYRDVSSPWCSIAVWRDSLSFTAFVKSLFLFHNAIKVSFSHIQGICKLSRRMYPLNLSQTFSTVIWSTGLNLKKN